MKKICLVIGSGAGVGGNVAKKFAEEGFHVYLCRRTNQEGLDNLISEIKDLGGEASGSLLNVIDENSIEDIVTHIEKNVGPIEVAVYNIGAQIGNRNLKDTSYKAFEMGWKMATFGLFRLAQVLTPLMEDRQSGTILVTSATSAVRGNKGQISHASAMGGRRMICQSLNAEFAPKNIHVAHIIIDGAVDAPDTLGKMLGEENFQKLRETKGMEHDGLLVPERIAETYLHIALQHRSAWTHEICLLYTSDAADE